MWDKELRERRTAVITFDNDVKQIVTVTMPSERYKWHADLERAVIKEWNAKWPNAAHKVIGIHILRK